MTDLAERWPLADHRDVRDALLAAYADPSRGYHDTLPPDRGAGPARRARERRGGLRPGHACALAAWFHDAVYDGGRDAEERSAVWAEEALAGTPYAAEVARLVRLTETHDPGRGRPRRAGALRRRPGDPGGAERARYDEYVAGVRREYAHVSDADFAAGRAAVLRDLAGRDRLFHTAYARERWEPPPGEPGPRAGAAGCRSDAVLPVSSCDVGEPPLLMVSSP